MTERKPYPSDFSRERRALIEPVITAWKAARPSVSGHQGAYDMRDGGIDRPSTTCCAARRERRGRSSEPSLGVPDTQSIRAAVSVPADTTGNDAGERTSGRKHGGAAA